MYLLNVIGVATSSVTNLSLSSGIWLMMRFLTNSAISFEYDAPSVSEFEERIRKTKERYPYLLFSLL